MLYPIQPNLLVVLSIVTNSAPILKLKRVTACVLRFVKNAKLKVQGLTQEKLQTLTINELSNAELLWIKDNQHSYRFQGLRNY